MSADRARSLTALVREFNLAPARYVDPSWLPPAWADAFAARRSSLHPRALAVVSRWLLREHALERDFDFDFSASEKRVALLDQTTLAKLARYLGACVHVRALRGLIHASAVAALVGKLGRETYEFAMRRATPMASAAARLDPSDASLLAQLTREGSRRLFGVIGDAPSVRRVRLKLPREAWCSNAAALSGKERAETRRVLLLRLIPELEPKWASLF